MRNIIFAILFILLLPAAVFAATPANPGDLPKVLQTAIDSKDSSKALTHLDLERIINNVFQEALPLINESVSKKELVLNPVLAAALGSLNSSNAATQRMAIIFLSDELSKFLAYGVESGAFAGEPVPENEMIQMDGGVFSKFGDISMERKEFRDTALISQSGSQAVVRTTLCDYGVRQGYPLELKLENISGTWKVVGIDNAAALYRQILEQNR